MAGSFRSLFDKNVREEFLGQALSALQAELAGSPLVLACYASPTVCDAIKHYRVSANAMLDMELDGCRAVEGALGDARRRTLARAVKECLDEKARRGVPLDEALRQCGRVDTVRGLDGRPVREIDLMKELGLSESLGPPLTIGAGTVKAESHDTAVVEAYEARRRRALEAWERAVGGPQGADLAGLGPVTRAEVEQVSLMEPALRAAVVRSLAAAKALADIVTEVHEVERRLEAAELVAAPELREEMERRRAFLRHEMARLVEAFEADRRLNAAVAEAQAAAATDVSRQARERLAARRAKAAAAAVQEDLGAWGSEGPETERRRP